MTFYSLLRVETRRLVRDRLTWLLTAFAGLAPALGVWVYRPLPSYSSSGYLTSVNGTYLGNPAMVGALAGAILFALLTALELNRVQRTRTDVLTDTIVSPFSAAVVRTLALILVAAAAQVLTLLVWFPFTHAQIGAVFRLDLYVTVYLAVMLPAMIFAVLFTAAAYHITRRLDLTLALFAAFVLLSLLVWDEHWLLRWINPSMSYLSDVFGTSRLLRSVLWNRLFWLLLLSAAWIASFLGVRRYNKGLFGSLALNIRKLYVPLLAAVLAVGGCLTYTSQPFVDHSKKEINFAANDNIQFNEQVTLSSIHVTANPELAAGRQRGEAVFKLLNASGKTQTISFSVVPGYTFTSATANGKAVAFRDLANDELNAKTMEVDIPADKKIELSLEYGGFPQEWNILELTQGGTEQISRDYVYLANQSFAPIPLDFDWQPDGVPDYIIDLSLPSGMTPVFFGTETAVQTGEHLDGTVQWRVKTSRTSAILYAGDYASHSIKAAGIDVDFWYSAKHAAIMKQFSVDDVIRQVFEYCTTHYGPLQFYKDNKMRIVEIGSSGGGYAGNGASVMGEDSFSERGLKDSRKGAGGNEVLAHEIIHQWWGLGNMFSQEDPEATWSSEGLTVYTTYRLMKEIYGEAYAKQNYVDHWQAEVNDYYQNFYIRNPEYMERLPKSYRTELANSLSQMRQYSEMPLKILKAEQLVGGEKKMDDILSGLFNREVDPNSPYLTYQQFLDACGLTKEELKLE
ncbi:M1 aminopeptidase family protein [Paenibacillus sp. BAC0078]